MERVDLTCQLCLGQDSGARIFLVWGPAREQEAGEYGGGRAAAHPLKVPSGPLIIAPHACSASENQSEVKIWEEV